jgi:hypothetical protein
LISHSYWLLFGFFFCGFLVLPPKNIRLPFFYILLRNEVHKRLDFFPARTCFQLADSLAGRKVLSSDGLAVTTITTIHAMGFAASFLDTEITLSDLVARG